MLLCGQDNYCVLVRVTCMLQQNLITLLTITKQIVFLSENSAEHCVWKYKVSYDYSWGVVQELFKNNQLLEIAKWMLNKEWYVCILDKGIIKEKL